MLCEISVWNATKQGVELRPRHGCGCVAKRVVFSGRRWRGTEHRYIVRTCGHKGRTPDVLAAPPLPPRNQSANQNGTACLQVLHFGHCNNTSLIAQQPDSQEPVCTRKTSTIGTWHCSHFIAALKTAPSFCQFPLPAGFSRCHRQSVNVGPATWPGSWR